jgi:hypothetical protein
MTRKSIQIADLLYRIEFAKKSIEPLSGLPDQPRIFVASFCGALQTQYPEVARALANAAGMGHLTSAKVSQ